MESYQIIYFLKNPLNESKILGANNSLLSFLQEILEIELFIHQAEVKIKEKDFQQKEYLIKLFTILEDLLDNGINLSARDLITITKNVKEGTIDALKKLYLQRDVIITLYNGKAIYPKSLHQQNYLKALKENEIIFSYGPAGTGKTYLAVLFAVNLLKRHEVKKIILVRPVVEAGEKLGFLPGDLKEKIDPYLTPLYDALSDCLGKETSEKMMEKGIIEVAPLAYMRGRTLDNAIIILDEAQNTTKVQMKMFLTRLGFGSKMIITGDITQIDLPNKSSSGLLEALNITQNIKGVSHIQFDASDVMRHPLVFKIVQRYNDLSKSLEKDNENNCS